MTKILDRNFFNRSADVVARDLLGKFIIRDEIGKLISGKIVETEAYLGIKDEACHAYGGKMTPRTKVLFEEPGLVYIYFVYGIHWQLNLTCSKPKAGCVLIRAVEPAVVIDFANIKKAYSNNPKRGPSLLLTERMKIAKVASGPGKVCRFLKLDTNFYGEDVVNSKRIHLEDRGISFMKKDIAVVPRVGINYAGKWKDRLLRFYVRDSQAVSRR